MPTLPFNLDARTTFVKDFDKLYRGLIFTNRTGAKVYYKINSHNVSETDFDGILGSITQPLAFPDGVFSVALFAEQAGIFTLEAYEEPIDPAYISSERSSTPIQSPPFLKRLGQISSGASFTAGVFDVSEWQALHVLSLANVDHRVRFQWYDAPLGTPNVVSIAQFDWHVHATQLLDAPTRHLGPFCEVVMFGQINPFNYSLVCYNHNRDAYPGVGTARDLARQQNVAVGAGGSSSTIFSYPYCGPVKVWFSTDATAYAVQVRSEEYNSASSEVLWQKNQGSGGAAPGGLTDEVYLPPDICSVNFVNGDGIARVFSVVVVPLYQSV